jgi:WD40 repeat protein
MTRLLLRVAAGTLAIAVIALAATYIYLSHGAPPARSPEIFLQHGHLLPVETVAFSPDGRIIASGSNDKTIKVWDTATGTLRGTLSGHAGLVLSVAFSPDGQTLASSSDDRTIKLWNAATGTLRATLPALASAITSIAFSPDGQSLASGSDDGKVALWDVATGQVRAMPMGHDGRVTSVALSPDGRSVASASVDDTVKLWDVVTGALRATLTGHESAVLSVVFSADARTVASSSADGTIRLWNAATGAKGSVMQGRAGPVWSIAFSPDARTVASGNDDTSVNLWNAETGALRATLSKHTDRVRSVAFSPDGRTVASGSDDSSVKLWNVSTGDLRETLAPHTGRLLSVAISPDGRLVASASDDRTVRLWDATTGALRAALSGHKGPVWSVAFSPDGKTLASGGSDNSIRLWDVATTTPRATLNGHDGPVVSVAFSGDGRTLASGSVDNKVKLWDLSTGAERATYSQSGGVVRTVAFTADSKMVASGSDDNAITLWNGDTTPRFDPIPRFGTPMHAGAGIRSLAFSRNGRFMASASLDTITLWDAATGVERATLTGHASTVTSVAFSPDGEVLASGSDDHTVRLWDTTTGALRATLRGHEGSVLSVAWGVDGHALASCSADGTIAVWNTGTGQRRTLIEASPGGQYLVLYPGLHYRSSRQPGEPEPAAIRFNGRLDNAYPLHYYRHDLRISDPSALPAPDDVTIAPAFVRLAFDQWQHKPLWLLAGSAVYAAVVASAILYWRRTDALQIAKTFFGNAFAGDVQVLGNGLLKLGGSTAAPAFGMLFDAASTQPSAKPARAPALSGKLYVIYAGHAPTSAQLSALRRQGTEQIIPLSSRDMTRALFEGGSGAEVLRRLEEPFVARNDPYDEQRPVESELLFFGRSEALENIPQALLQGQHVGLFGLRKVGKTSLLNRVRDRIVTSPCVWIDCQGYEAVAVDLFRAILAALRQELVRLGVGRVPATPAVNGSNDFRAAFLAYFDAWRERSAAARVVLLFDEVDKYFPTRRDIADQATLRAYVSLFGVLRALGQEHQCLSVMAVAYRPDLNRRNQIDEHIGDNPMFMGYHEYFLQFLSLEETATMLRDLGRWKSIDWTDEALARVHVLSGGHPLVSRIIASDACERGKRKNVTIMEVENTGCAIRDGFARHRVGSYIAESIWQMLRPDERTILSHIAAHAGGALDLGHDFDDALANLHHFGLVDSDDQHLRLRGELLRDWVERNG